MKNPGVGKIGPSEGRETADELWDGATDSADVMASGPQGLRPNGILVHPIQES